MKWKRAVQLIDLKMMRRDLRITHKQMANYMGLSAGRTIFRRLNSGNISLEEYWLLEKYLINHPHYNNSGILILPYDYLNKYGKAICQSRLSAYDQ